MAKDSDAIVREWLAEYKSLAESAIPKYAEELQHKDDILIALMNLFKSCSDGDATSNSSMDLLQPVCHQLFEFYKSGVKELKYFTINLFPSVILSHIVANSFAVVTGAAPVDALILSIFALENTSQHKDDSPGLEIPQLVNPSIYHDPMKGVFADRVVNVHSTGPRFYQAPLLPEYNVILPSNRYQILNKLLTTYCEHIAVMKKVSHINLCKTCTFLASSGFPWQSKYLAKEVKLKQTKKRYQLGVEFIMTLLRGVYFALYNECWEEGFTAIEAMQRRARRELIPQAIFLSNAIMNSARTEAREHRNVASMEQAPFGLSSAQLTPLLVRENSKKGSRWAATAKSIRDHRWRHNNEEISGDLSRSLQNPDAQTGKPIPTIITENEDTGKPEKHTTSPSKLLKSKLKKSGSQMTGVTDKTKSPAASTGERKSNKKLQTDLSTEETDSEKQRNSPLQRRETPSKKATSPHLSRKPSKSSMKKQPSLDETSLLATAMKSKGMTGSKSTNDSLAPSTGRTPSTSLDTAYTKNESSPSKHNTSATPLLENSKLDSSCESGSEGQELMNGERSKESIPLLPNSEPTTTIKHQNGTQQTIF